MNPGIFDLINPLDGVLGRTLHGPMHRFTFRADSEYSGYEVEKMLRRYGIRIWGREMAENEDRAFLVKESQAIWAEYLLCRAGIPLTCKLLDPRNESYRQRQSVAKQGLDKRNVDVDRNVVSFSCRHAGILPLEQ